MNGSEESAQSLIFFIVSGIALAVLVSAFIFILIFKFVQRKRQFQLEKEEIRAAAERELLNAQLEISEQLMRDISQEIHDNIGAELALAKLQFNSVATEGNEEQVRSGTERISRAIAQLRDLSKSLNGNYVLNQGLYEAISREVNLIDSSGRMKCELVDQLRDHPTFTDQQQILLFRCVQEALNNALKHSGAKHLTVTLSHRADKLLLEVKDNGHGFGEKKDGSRGLGLQSMQQRMQVLGGSLSVLQGNPGVTVVFELPWDE